MNMRPYFFALTAATVLATVASLGGCSERSTADSRSSAASAAGDVTLTAEQAREVAAEAYVYLYPAVQNYQTMYQFAVDKDGAEYKGPMNMIANVARVFTPADTTIVTANSDTPYSYVVMDLRAEPLVITMPKIESGRYYSLQLVDLYTHNVDYLGTRNDGNDGGSFLIAGPQWQGETPSGVKRIVRSPTSFMFGQFRTQLLNEADLENVKKIQSQYRAQPLSAFMGRGGERAKAPPVDFPEITQERLETDFWRYANFLLQFAPPLPGEEGLRARFERIGVRPGGEWPPASMPEELSRAVIDGQRAARTQLEADILKVKSSEGLFGKPALMAGKYKERALGALGGIYGNDVEETLYVSYMLDEKGAPLDASKASYTITFPPGGLPPVDAFWSVTMYDGKTRLMVDNPIDRYLINSPMLPKLKKGPDGSVSLYVQHKSPGRERESNWLPAPNGQMAMVLRMYLPRPEALKHEWQAPPVVQVRQQ